MAHTNIIATRDGRIILRPVPDTKASGFVLFPKPGPGPSRR